MTGKGKAPAKKRPAPRVVEEEMHSDESIEPDEPEGNDPRPAAAAGGIAFRHQHVEPDNPQMLPQELLERTQEVTFDMSDEEGEDHTGYWRDGA